MELNDIINKIDDLSASFIVDLLFKNNTPYEVFNKLVIDNGGWYSHEKRKSIFALYKGKDNDVFNNASLIYTIESFQNYLTLFPNGVHKIEAQSILQSLIDDARRIEVKKTEKNVFWQELIKNPNSITPDELFEKGITKKEIQEMNIEGLTDEIVEAVFNYKQPNLIHNKIPQVPSDIPAGYTDVFFWGIPSSGKTCALATIIDTIKSDYNIEDPDIKVQFGGSYRHSLEIIFDDNTGIGNLPGRTIEDRTQYMPFLLKRKKEKNYRKISFFELSGEVFKHFYNLTYNVDSIEESPQEDKIKIGFETLKLLLDSENQKIHFFFIDYDYQTQTKKVTGWTQSQYLEAATTYFRDNKNIFKKKTDAIYIVITKADEIKGDDKQKKATEFLAKNFSNFMDVIKSRAKKDNINFNVKLFSIGKVWFKRICVIDRSYANSIIIDLLDTIDAHKDNKISHFFNR